MYLDVTDMLYNTMDRSSGMAALLQLPPICAFV